LPELSGYNSKGPVQIPADRFGGMAAPKELTVMGKNGIEKLVLVKEKIMV